MNLKRLLPLLLLVGLALAAYGFGLGRYFTLDALRDNRAALVDLVATRPWMTGGGFVALYAALVALSLPGAAVMTVAGGLLFGFAGAALSLSAATAGATLVFLFARSAFGDWARARAGAFVQRMAEGFRRDGFYYLLFLRLVPALPFWAVNLAPALLGMRLVPFVVATALGSIPGSLVFTAFGVSLGEVFDSGEPVSLSAVFSPTTIAALVGLGVLSLLPIVVRRLRGARR